MEFPTESRLAGMNIITICIFHKIEIFKYPPLDNNSFTYPHPPPKKNLIIK